jgi:hypothetical protein
MRCPSELNEDNLNNIRCETSRHFKNKKGEYLKDKIDELATNSKNNNIRDQYREINKFKNGYQPRRNLVTDENGDLLAVEGSCEHGNEFSGSIKYSEIPD